MLSPAMLDVGNEGINVFEIIPSRERGEFVPEFDTQEFLETHRRAIERSLDSTIYDTAAFLYNLKLLGYKHIATREASLHRHISVINEIEKSMYMRVLKDQDPQRKYGEYTQLDVLAFSVALNSKSISLSYLTMFAASVSPDFVEELEQKHHISEGLLSIVVEKSRLIQLRSTGESSTYFDLCHFLAAAAALKTVFPEKLPKITYEEWEMLTDTLKIIVDGKTEEAVDLQIESAVELAAYMYILSSEKAEFTESGLVITPRGSSALQETMISDIPDIPQIRRF